MVASTYFAVFLPHPKKSWGVADCRGVGHEGPSNTTPLFSFLLPPQAPAS